MVGDGPGSAGDPGATPPRGSGTRWTPVEILPPLVLLAAGGTLVARGGGLWFDELFTAQVSRLPLAEILRAGVRGQATVPYLDGIPPSYNLPYYLLTHLWLRLPGTGSDASLRLFTLLAAAVGVALLVRAVARVAGTPVGVLAGVAVAVNPLVVDQSVQARPYGLVLLATGAAALGLARWLDGARGGWALLAVAGAGMGLAHWYAAPALAGLVTAGVVLRPHRWRALLGAGVVAAAPVTALVAMNLLNGNGSRNAGHVLDTGGALPLLAVRAWAGGAVPLLVVTVALAAVALLRSPRTAVLGAAWVAVPLLGLTAVEQVRPVYFPRYLLASLLGLAVLAAVGALGTRLSRPLAAAAAAALVLASAHAGLPQLERGPRERADDVVADLASRQLPGEPVVAVDHRGAVGLERYVPLLAPRLSGDLVLAPDDAPPGAERVWLVRNVHRGVVYPTDDDALLAADGLRLVEEVRFAASTTTLAVQRWERWER